MRAIVFHEPEHIAILDDEGRSYRYEDYADELRAFVESPDAQQMAFPHLIANEA